MTTHKRTPMQVAYEASDYTSYAQVQNAVYDRLGRGFTPTPETIRAYHHNERTEKLDVVVVAAIADVYGTTVKKIAPALATYVDTARDLLSGSSGWMTDAAASELCPA